MDTKDPDTSTSTYIEYIERLHTELSALRNERDIEQSRVEQFLQDMITRLSDFLRGDDTEMSLPMPPYRRCPNCEPEPGQVDPWPAK